MKRYGKIRVRPAADTGICFDGRHGFFVPYRKSTFTAFRYQVHAK